jgi:SAM-dependent methyltransferase
MVDGEQARDLRHATAEPPRRDNDEDAYHCVVCGSVAHDRRVLAEDHYYGNSGTFTYLRCSGCGVWSLFPTPAPDDVAGYYPSAYYAFGAATFSDWLRSWRGDGFRRCLSAKGYPVTGGASWRARVAGLYYRSLGRAALDDIPPSGWGRDYLDFGCGANGTVALMQALGWRAIGLEISDQAVTAGRKAGLDIRRGTATEHALPPASFDFIYSHHSFEHVPDPAAALMAFARLLRPGGRALIVQPNAAGACAWFGRHWGYLGAPVHLHLHTPRSMETLAARCGLQVERMTTRAGQDDIMDTAALLTGQSTPERVRPRLTKLLVLPLALPLAMAGKGCELVTLLRREEASG